MANDSDKSADKARLGLPASVPPAQDAADFAEDPDMEEWRKEFGDKTPDAVKEFLKYRHREWELNMEADLKARQEASAKQTQKP